MVTKLIEQRLKGVPSSTLPQDTLVVVLNDQRLQFVVADHLGFGHMVKAYEDPNAETPAHLLQGVFSIDAHLRATYTRIFLLLRSFPVLLRPSIALNVGEDQYADHFMPLSDDQDLVNDKIPQSDILVSYPLSRELLKQSEKMFPNLKVIHDHTYQIAHFQSLSRNLPGNRLFVTLFGSQICLIFFKNAKLQFSNQFEVGSVEDVIYYIMLVVKQFELDTAEDNVYVAIESELGLSSLSKLRSYVKNLQVLEFSDTDMVYQGRELFQSYYHVLSSPQTMLQL